MQLAFLYTLHGLELSDDSLQLFQRALFYVGVNIEFLVEKIDKIFRLKTCIDDFLPQIMLLHLFL